jgi:hypothetical protein
MNLEGLWKKVDRGAGVKEAYLVPERKVHSGTILDCGLQILD